MRLPSRVSFPFGYVVLVRQVSDTEMLAEQEEDDRDEVADGLWDDDARTIYVRKSLPLTRRRYVLGHEMHHAVTDFNHAMLNAGAMRP